MTTAPEWRQRAIALRRDERMIEAADAIDTARGLDRDDPLTAFLHAQLHYELGDPAAALFAEARRLWPDNADIVRNRALALVSEGDPQAADDLLSAELRTAPEWLEGHRILSSLRWSRGGDGFDTSYAQACRALPRHAGLRLGWFSGVAQLRDWPRARQLLDEAEAALGGTAQLRIARAFVAAESGEDAEALKLFAELAEARDDVLDLARIRFHLRLNEPEAAQAIALPLLGTPLAGQIWPYLSLIWRLIGDARAQWLDGDPPYVRVLDVGLSGDELDELAACLRTLHAARIAYPEQSVRGGSQTDRSVLLRREPILQTARAKLMEAVAAYVAALPPPDPRHPLLGRPRDRQRIGGSWSVRLEGGGNNVAHTHPMGWLSSAFYVALPGQGAGDLCLGTPPLELGLGLPPYGRITPERGKLVLFPSTMWHSTLPFAQGERLNIAFDIVPG